MPEALRLRIQRLVAGGDGLAFREGKAVFVPFALPGEEVFATIDEEKRDYCRARLVELIEASKYRVSPLCPIYGECGGCNLQHLAYRRQVEEKSLIVGEAFARNARFDAGRIETASSIPFAYRNRMQLHFTRGGRIGFMRRSSSEVVEAPSCPIALRPIQAWIEERAGTSRGREEMAPYTVGKERFIMFGYGDEVWLEGRDSVVSVTIAGRSISFHLKGFFQSNLYLLENLVKDAVQGLSGARAADLYCGVGLFGAFLSTSFDKVVCVEENPYALDLARSNLQGCESEFYALSVDDWLRSGSASGPFDVVVVDPPRTGLSPALRAWFAEAEVRRIVYVSCDPATLARDAGELVRSGYIFEGVKVYDFYPQTSHIECLARFSHG
jgi:23S rRNA (uracil1939-C5)-methyltransferase